MTNRADVVALAMSQRGTLVPSDYDGPNPYTQQLGRGVAEAWCGDFVTAIYHRAGLPLPLLQGGMPGRQEGFSYVPAAMAWARLHGAVVTSWDAQPGDLCCFDWDGNGVADHVEMVVSWGADTLTTVGGNSGPRGGVNLHTWPAPRNVGNGLVLAVVNADRLVTFGPPAGGPAWPGRVLQLTSRYMAGADVATWQHRAAALGYAYAPTLAAIPPVVAWTLAAAGYRPGAPFVPDGVYGPQSAGVCVMLQRQLGITEDAAVGPQTWAASFR